MPNIIRKDIVQISVETDTSGLDELNRKVNKVTNAISGGINDNLDDTEKAIKNVGKADGLEHAAEDAKDLSDNADKAGKELDDVAKTNFDKLTAGLSSVSKKLSNIAGKVAKISIKGAIVGITATATAIGKITYDSVKAFADFEQNVGGVEKLFGTGGKDIDAYAKSVGKSVEAVKSEFDKLTAAQDIVLKNANNSYTLGFSANEYMENVTGFAASLITDLGGDTKTAAELANMAIQDMADNANVFGTDMETVRNVYQALAKNQYQVLDNLKLGYGGTKEGATKLIADAAKLDESIKANDLSFSNLVKAINVIQKDMGILGATEKEAAGTITGSLNATKAAWGNLLIAIGSGENMDQCMDNMIDSVETFAKNVIPVAEKALGGIGTLIERLAPIISDKLPALAKQLLPPSIKAAVSLFQGLVKELPSIIKVLFTTLADILGEEFPILGKIFSGLADSFKKIAKLIPVIIALVAAFKMFSTIKSVSNVFTGLFGKKSGNSEDAAKQMTKPFEGFSKIKTKDVLKGIANLTIILVAMIALTTIVAFAALIIDAIADFGAIIKLVAIMSILGIAGTQIAKSTASLGDIQVTTVLKGIANMTIVLAGMTALMAAILLLSPLLAKIVDIKSLAIVVAIMGLLGVVGAAATKAAGSIGNIPVKDVAKGLANIAIMVAGLSALFLLVGAVSLLDFDYKRMASIIGIMGLLGAVGAACTVFAGIASLIPIPAVAMGLAGIAIALAGIAAIIIAFGAIAEIPGISYFIDQGGKLLVKIFSVLGECVGAIIGGLAAQISNALPVIGQNLADFAKNVKPMFDIFAGADMSGIGDFFLSLSAFLISMTGSGILEALTSWFTGGTNFEDIGKNLTILAEGSTGFFKTVNGLPEGSFDKASSFLDCIAGVKSLPKEGGVKQWFTGDIAWTSVANGLQTLSGQGPMGFFKKVAQLPEESFDKTKKLFAALADLDSLPKEGGVKGWFNGEIDYDAIATNLPKLGDGAKKFFDSISHIKDFSLMSKLFKEINRSVEIFGTDGGLWDKIGDFFTGDENSGLIKMAKDLGSFAKKSANFFKLITSENLSNLTKFWDTLANPKLIDGDALDTLETQLTTITEKVKKLPEDMGKGLVEAGDALKNSLVSIWVEAAKAMAAPVNKIISGANWILKQFGSDKKIATWTPYAKGTDGHKGGNALVNDGRGAELVQMPNGNTFIPTGKNVFIPNAPKGMKVLPAESTAQLLGKKSPTFNYAKGTGEIDVWNYIDDAKGLVSAVEDKFVNYNGLSDYTLDASKAMVSTVSNQMVTWTDKLFDELGNIKYDVSKGVTQWLPVVTRALKMEKQYSLLNVARTLFQMKTESGGNPNAINLWDSNAKKGTPSKGLMQVIDPTFKAYAHPAFDKNIYDPLSNILASVRYAVSRYGSLARAYRGKGYANGGIATKPSIFGEDGAEMAIPLTADKRKRGVELWQQTGSMLGISSYSPERDYANYTQTTSNEYNTYSPQFSITISGSNDDRVLARKIKKFVQEGINDCFESISRQSPKVREV